MKIKLTVISLMLLIMTQCGNGNGNGNTIEDQTHFFKTICIEGHVYYTRSVGDDGYLSIKLTDDGKPVKCYQ